MNSPSGTVVLICHMKKKHFVNVNELNKKIGRYFEIYGNRLINSLQIGTTVHLSMCIPLSSFLIKSNLYNYLFLSSTVGPTLICRYMCIAERLQKILKYFCYNFDIGDGLLYKISLGTFATKCYKNVPISFTISVYPSFCISVRMQQLAKH
jgi:hypothetical protein